MIKKIILLVCSLMFLTISANAQGKIVGGKMHETPTWFKQTFYDINEDVEEAMENNKHYMLFMDLEGCPYCTKMLKENFKTDGGNKEFIQKYFDVVNINVKGSIEIAWDEDTTYTEKQLAEKLKIQYSPTILFFNHDKEVVVRVNGYRTPAKFKQILEYVQGKHYDNMTLTQYVNKIADKSLYTLKDNAMFKDLKDLSKISTPLAVIFEDGSCTACDFFHDNLLSNKEVQGEFSKYTVVRLDALSDEKIIDVDGNETTPKKWVEKQNLDYRPGMLLFNESKLIATADALLYSFHFKELLRYVSGKHYIKYPDTYLDYLNIRQDELIKEGKVIDISK